MFGHKMDVRKGFMASFGYMWQVGDHFQIKFEIFFVTFNPELSLGVNHVSLEVSFFQYVTPLMCAATFSYYLWSNYLKNYTPTKYDDYEYPPWGEAIGMCMALSSIICIPVYLLIDFIRTPGATFSEVLLKTYQIITPVNRPRKVKFFGKSRISKSIRSRSFVVISTQWD